jgi:hypothetical protein
LSIAPVLPPESDIVAQRIGWRYGALIGAVALAQVAVAATTAVAHQGALVILQREADPTAGLVPIEQVLPPIATGALSCGLGGLIALLAAFLAARLAGRLTGDARLGQRAGMLAAQVGTGIWLLTGIIAALWLQTDGALLVADPYQGTSPLIQGVVIAIVVGIRDALLGGITLLLALLVARAGGRAGSKLRVMKSTLPG